MPRSRRCSTTAIRLGSAEVRELLKDEAKGIVGGTSVVLDARGDALYFSKRLIPHLPAGALDGELSPVRFHVGVYCYRRAALEQPQEVQQRVRVFSSRDSHEDPIAFLDETEVGDRPAGVTEQRFFQLLFAR